MKTEEELIWEAYILENTTRSNIQEIKYYFEEIFGELYSNLNFEKIKSSDFINTSGIKKDNINDDPNDHPKFDHTRFNFIYKGTTFVKVFSGPGDNASKSDNGSLSVSVYQYLSEENLTRRKYDKKDTNAFYNKNTKNVDYDPIIQNGKDLLLYIKSILDRDDRDKDMDYTPPPQTPVKKQTPTPVYA